MSGNIGVFGLMGTIFVVLKLAGVTQIAQWSWLWVLAPFWGPIVVIVVLAAILAAISD